MNKLLKNALWIIVGIIMFVLASAYGKSCGKYLSNKILPKTQITAEEKKNLEKQVIIEGMKKTEIDVNKRAPFMLDDVTRFDRCEVRYPHQYTFQSIMVLKKDLSLEHIEQIRKTHATITYKVFRTDPKIRYLLEHGIIYHYYVSDKIGKKLYNITVTKEDL